MTSSRETLPGVELVGRWATRVIVPEAVVLIPLILKWRAAGEGDGDGVGLDATGLGEDDTVAVLLEPPQAAALNDSAISATHLFKPAIHDQFRPWRYPFRLLDGYRALTTAKRKGRVAPALVRQASGTQAWRQPGRPARRHST